MDNISATNSSWSPRGFPVSWTPEENCANDWAPLNKPWSSTCLLNPSTLFFEKTDSNLFFLAWEVS